MTAEEKIHLAVLKILNRSSLKLFGCLIYKFELIILDEPGTAMCSINQQTKKPVITFFRKFIDKEIENVEGMIYLILHEIIHFVDGHLNKCRIDNKDPRIFNLAADHIINTMLDNDCSNLGALKGIIIPPSNRFIIPELINTPNLTLMEAYEYLMNNIKRISFEEFDGMVNVYIDNEYKGKISLDLPEKGSEAEGSEELSTELKSEIRAIINNIIKQQKGAHSGKIFEFLKNISKLEISWDILLENVIQTSLIKSNNNRSWKNIKKKIRHLGIKIPNNSKEVIMDNLYIIIDTSGSMSNIDQGKFVNLIIQSINFFKHIVIIQHDVKIQNILNVDRENFEYYKEEIFKIYGRGGTSHLPVFKYIENMFFEEEEKIGLIILATDYESDIDIYWNNFEFHKFIPVKVLCNSKKKISKMVDPKPIYC